MTFKTTTFRLVCTSQSLRYAVAGDAAAVWCFSALADVSNEQTFPTNSPTIKRLLPRQSFTRGLISMKSMLLLVPALRLQTPTSLLGPAHVSALYLFQASSSSHSPPFMFPFSSLPRRLRVFVFSPLSSFKSRQVGANSLAVFSPLLFIHFLVFCVCGCVLSISHSASMFLQIELKESLDQPFLKEGNQLWCIFTRKHTVSWIWPIVEMLDKYMHASLHNKHRLTKRIQKSAGSRECFHD